MLTVGLTGGIASGKSTAAAMFRDAGAAVFDADAAVHTLYAGAAVQPVEAAFPGATKDGAVDRAELGARIVGDPAELARLEAIVHPLVHEAEAVARAEAKAAGRRLFVIDSPLLLETGGDAGVDAVVVVSVPPEVQKARALSRPGMTEARFAALSARQWSDAEKRARAHFVIDSSGPLAVTRQQVASVIRAVAGIAAGK